MKSAIPQPSFVAVSLRAVKKNETRRSARENKKNYLAPCKIPSVGWSCAECAPSVGRGLSSRDEVAGGISIVVSVCCSRYLCVCESSAQSSALASMYSRCGSCCRSLCAAVVWIRGNAICRGAAQFSIGGSYDAAVTYGSPGTGLVVRHRRIVLGTHVRCDSTAGGPVTFGLMTDPQVAEKLDLTFGFVAVALQKPTPPHDPVVVPPRKNASFLQRKSR